MHSSTVGVVLLVSVLHLAGAGLLWAQSVPPEIESVKLAEQVYMLTISFDGVQSGAHLVASAGPDGVFLVDDHFSPFIFSSLIESEVRSLSGGGEVEYVFNTHYHLDHNGGNGYFVEKGSVVLAHENVRTRLAEGTSAMGLVEPGVLVELPPRPEGDLPTQTFEEAFEIEFNGETVEITHHPRSHTDGDGVVYFSSSHVLAVGDLFWPYQFPYVDLLNGGSALGLAETIGELIERMPDDVQIVTGHGPLTTLEDLQAVHLMLIETIAAVREQWEAGGSLTEIQAAGLDATWATWAHPLVPEATWIEMIFDSLEGGTTQGEAMPNQRRERLLPASPNPTRGKATIRYTLAEPAPVELSVYSLRGRRLAVLESAVRQAGSYAVSWSGTDEAGQAVASGTYVLRLRTPEGIESQLLTLVR